MDIDSFYRPVLAFLIVVLSAQGEKPYHRPKRDVNVQPVETYTRYGTVRGSVPGSSHDVTRIRTFLGIPYAKPPIGKRRFARPEAPDHHDDDLDATEPRPPCPHRPIAGDVDSGSFATSEDCLYLDIYAPEASPGAKIPVMCHLQDRGGSSGLGALLSLKTMAARGVVVISINYRLDIFGFLSTQDKAIPGNFGLLDISMALKWVKDSVFYFGGDPDRITVFGQGSGADMLSVMRISPVLSGQFNAAIIQSGSALAQWAVNQDRDQWYRPRHLAAEMGERLGCEFQKSTSQHGFYPRYSSSKLLDCLKDVDTDRVMNISIQMQTEAHTDYFAGRIWVPVVEVHFDILPDVPLLLLHSAWDLRRIPTIYGYAVDDGSRLFPGLIDKAGLGIGDLMLCLEKLIETFYSSDEVDDILLQITEVYLPDGDDYSKDQLVRIVQNILTDFAMVAPILREARVYENAAQGDVNLYMYEFDYTPSFVAQTFTPSDMSDTDRKLSDDVVTIWTNFAKHWNPTPSPVDGVTWSNFVTRDGRSKEEKVLLIKDNLEIQQFRRSERLKVWTVAASGASLPCSLTFNLFIALFLGLTEIFGAAFLS